MQEYAATMSTIDRVIDERISAMPTRGGRREITEDQWRRELGQDRSGYRKAHQAYVAKCVNVPGHLLASITARS